MTGPTSSATGRTGHRPPGPRVWLLVGLVVAIELVWALVVLLPADEAALHDAPVTVVAPAVMSEPLAGRLDQLDGAPLQARGTEQAEGARADLAEGGTSAVLVVDPSGTEDELLLDTRSAPELNDALQAHAERVEAGYGRTVTVTRTGPEDGAAQLDRARLATVLASVGGFLLVVVAALRRGPVAADARSGLRRLAVLLGVSTVLGLVLGGLLVPADGGGRALAALAVGLVALTAAAITVALDELLGWVGLGVAAALWFATALPLLARTDPHLLDQPWATLAPLTMPVAGLDAVVGAGLRGTLAGDAVLVLGAWLVTALLVPPLARRLRRRAGAPAPGTAEDRADEVAGSTAEDGAARPPAPARTGDAGGHARPWRLGVLALVSPLTLAMLAAILLTPEPAEAAPAEADARVTTTECVSTGPVEGVGDLNRIAELRGGEYFRGGDVGASVALQDGRMLWMFGDTLRDASAGARTARNSMLLVDDGCIRSVLPPDEGAIIPLRPAQQGDDRPVGYWPMSTYAVPREGYDLVYVTAQRVRSTGSEAFDFENLGPSVAVFLVPEGGTPQLIDQQDIGPDQAGREHPMWGAATTYVPGDGGGWVYLYGTANPGTDEAWGYSLRVARVRPDDVLDRSAWRYWDGSSWGSSEDAAQEMIPAQDGVSQTLSVFTRDGRWYAVSKRNDLLGSDVTIWTADAPTGPWSSGEAVAPTDAETGQLRYMPLAHPDVLPVEGTVVVSYSQNTDDLDEVIDDPLLYRPRFLRVDLP